jgi:peptide/nickel transport system permease protein
VRLFARKRTQEEQVFQASQWQLIWWKFRKHRLAMIGSAVIIFLYILVLFCEFLSPYLTTTRFRRYLYAPPQRLRFVHPEQGFRLRPFIYDMQREVDQETLRRYFVEDRSKTFDIQFFTHGEPY